MRLRKNRETERAGVNAVRALFEANRCVFQEIDTGNDYGKDAYVDITSENEVTGLCIALQIKSGPSYRRKGGYAIPIAGHAKVWRQSTVPVAGVVYDPENAKAYWCNITEFLTQHPKDLPAEIPVSDTNLLANETIHAVFRPAFEAVAMSIAKSKAVVGLCDKDQAIQVNAIADCFASGRSDPRFLILMRQCLSLFGKEATRHAIYFLSHISPHPDIFWTEANWIPESVRQPVLAHFRWTLREIARMLSSVDWELWQRGFLGQSLYHLLVVDPRMNRKLEVLAIEAARRGNERVASPALYVTLYLAGEKGEEKFRKLVAKEPSLERLPLIGYILDQFYEVGYLQIL